MSKNNMRINDGSLMLYALSENYNKMKNATLEKTYKEHEFNAIDVSEWIYSNIKNKEYNHNDYLSNENKILVLSSIVKK